MWRPVADCLLTPSTISHISAPGYIVGRPNARIAHSIVSATAVLGEGAALSSWNATTTRARGRRFSRTCGIGLSQARSATRCATPDTALD